MVAACAVSLLVACGGGSGQILGSGGTGTTGGSTTGGSTGGTTGTTTIPPSGIPQSLALAPAQTQITADGVSTARLTATLTDTVGAPVPNATLNFTTNAGRLSSATAVTDVSGAASVLLTSSTTAGRATVTVRESTTNLSAVTTIGFVPGAAAKLTITAAPSSVRPTDTVSIGIQVLDASGNPVAGEPVSLDVPTNSSNGLFAAVSAVTDVNGRVDTTYTAGSQTGSDTLRARTAGGVTSQATVAVTTAASQIGSIRLTLGAATAVADGTTATAVRAVVTDTAGRVIPGITVSFAATAGTLSSSSTPTDSTGTAQTSLVSPNRTGTATVRAASGGFSDSGSISFIAGAAQNVSINAAPATVAPNRSTALSIRVTDANGNAIGGKTITLSAPSGSGTLTSGTSSGSALSLASDSNGLASASFLPSATGASSVSISATAQPEGVANATTVTINPNAVSPSNLTLAALSSSAPADGQSQVSVRATVTGSDGGALAGVAINFRNTAGTPTSASVTTDGNGQATYTITSPTTPGTATVTASIGGLTQQTQLSFTSGAPSTLRLGLSPASVAVNGTTQVRAVVSDSNGFPVPGVTVQIDTQANSSGGSLASASVVTDSNGAATTTYTAGPGAFTTVTDRLRARVSGLSSAATADLNVTVQLSSLVLTASTASIVANGTDQASIRAVLTDSNGSAINGAPVTFRTSAGSFGGNATASVTTGTDGSASIVLTSGTLAGSAAVTATAGGLSGSTAIDFVAGPVSAILLSASPANVAIGASSNVTATLTDANGNPVSNQPVQFRVVANNTGGTLASSSGATDASGRVSVMYRSGAVSGTDTISASVASGLSQMTSLTSSSANARIGQLSLSLASSQVSAGTSSVIARAIVTDVSGSPVQGAVVTFASSRGSVTNTATTDSSGLASASVSLPTTAGPVRVQASISGFVAEQTLTITPAAASASNSSITASPSTLVADGSSTSTVTVLLNDAYGNPLSNGTSVTLLTTGGTLATNSQLLSSGRATFSLGAPSSPTNANVSVQGLGISTNVNFAASSSGAPASIRFAASSTQISVTGVGQPDTTNITLTVLDSSGNVIQESAYPTPRQNNVRLQFVSSPNGGETISATDVNGALQTAGAGGFIDVATQNGFAVINLRSGTLPGIVAIRASVLSFSGTSLSSPSDISTTATAPSVSIASGPPTTIAFSNPVTNSVENIGGGSYRRRGQVLVTDRYGNTVADGTVVNFTLLDTAITHDNTGSTVASSALLSRSGNSLITRRCTIEPTAGSEASGCNAPGSGNNPPATPSPSDFASAVTRNGSSRNLQANDRVLIRNAIDGDKIRSISSVDSPTQLTTVSQYLNSLSNGEFWAGASLLGGSIAGIDAAGNLVPGSGTTTNGIADLRVTYPANAGTILSGCYGYPYPAPSGPGSAAYSDRDRRDAVPQSRQVVVAASSGTKATAVSQGRFCFAGIANGTVAASPTSVALQQGASQQVSLSVNDGGDKIQLPYLPVSCFVSSLTTTNAFSISTSVAPNSDGDIATNVNGTASLTITRSNGAAASGDNATVMCLSGDGFTSISVTPILP